MDPETDPESAAEKEGRHMMKRLGLLAAGVAVGFVLTGYIVTKEIRSRESESTPEVKQDGLFAEVSGGTVRLYRVENGHFCGYHETKEFESQEKAVEWVVKETKAKLVITG